MSTLDVTLAYTYDERRLMVKLYNAGMSRVKIAEQLSALPNRPHRSAPGITNQLCQMGLLVRVGRGNGGSGGRGVDVVGASERRVYVEPKSAPPASVPGAKYVSTIPLLPMARLMAGR